MTLTKPWILGLFGTILLGGLVGAGLCRAVDAKPAVRATQTELPLPALDRAVARLAAEARGTHLASAAFLR